jgi:hypothetical protein
MVLGLNESVSMQSMTLTIQALRANTLTRRWFLHNLRRELATAVLLGLACGILVGAIVWIWALMAVGSVVAQGKSVRAFGSYEHVTSDGEHASGYSLDLWSYGGKLVGIIRVHRGLMGDPPAGLLEDVVYDPSSHKLSFRSKVTLGLFSDTARKEVPSRDLLTFTGTVTPARLNGTILTENKLCEKGCRESKRIYLHRSKEKKYLLKNFPNYDAWRKDEKDILDRYGPQW